MFKWLTANKEWFLSGIGVLVINYLLLFFFNFNGKRDDNTILQNVHIEGNVGGNLSLKIKDNKRKVYYRLILINLLILLLTTAYYYHEIYNFLNSFGYTELKNNYISVTSITPESKRLIPLEGFLKPEKSKNGTYIVYCGAKVKFEIFLNQSTKDRITIYSIEPIVKKISSTTLYNKTSLNLEGVIGKGFNTSKELIFQISNNGVENAYWNIIDNGELLVFNANNKNLLSGERSFYFDLTPDENSNSFDITFRAIDIGSFLLKFKLYYSVKGNNLTYETKPIQINN